MLNDAARGPPCSSKPADSCTRNAASSCANSVAANNPLDDACLEAPPLGHLSQRLADPEALPQLAEHERPAEAARVDDLDLAPRAGGDQFCGFQEPRDRRDEAPKRLTVDLIGATEIVDHLGDRAARHRVALVVGELEVRDNRSVPVTPSRLPQVHHLQNYMTVLLDARISEDVMCLRVFAFRTLDRASSRKNSIGTLRKCLRAPEVRSAGVRERRNRCTDSIGMDARNGSESASPQSGNVGKVEQHTSACASEERLDGRAGFVQPKAGADKKVDRQAAALVHAQKQRHVSSRYGGPHVATH